MAAIAGLSDLRGQGAPADIGLYQFGATALVFQFNFSGVTFTVAMASGVSGWVLIAQSAAGADDVEIQAAIDYIGVLGGGEIYVNEGTYLLEAPNAVYAAGWTASFVIDSIPVTFIGPGTFQLRDGVAGGTGVIIFFLEGTANAKFYRCSFDCNIANLDTPGTYVNAVFVAESATYTIEGCYFENYRWALYGDPGVNSVEYSIKSNIFYSPEYWSAIGIHNYGDRSQVIGNWILQCARGIWLDTCNNSIVSDNIIWKSLQGIALYDEASRNIISNNQILDVADGVNYGIDLYDATKPAGDGNLIIDNIIDGATGTIEVGIRTAGANNVVKNNRFRNVTLLIDDQYGTDTILATKTFQFIQGTTFISADGSAKGWEINAEADMAIALGQLPLEVQQVVRIKIWAVALGAPGAGGQMLLDIIIQAGADNLAYTTENINLAAFESVTTDYVATDGVHWSMDATDDADIGHLAAGMTIECKINGAPVSAPDEATNATFRVIEIEYV